MITRLEWGEQGHNPRSIVSNLAGDASALYDDLYCQRGEAENRIKEAQVGLFATRTSCHIFASNPLRVLLAALAYVLIERMRALALQGTELAKTQIHTLRIRLLRLAAVVTRNTRRVRLYFKRPDKQKSAAAVIQLDYGKTCGLAGDQRRRRSGLCWCRSICLACVARPRLTVDTGVPTNGGYPPPIQRIYARHRAA